MQASSDKALIILKTQIKEVELEMETIIRSQVELNENFTLLQVFLALYLLLQ